MTLNDQTNKKPADANKVEPMVQPATGAPADKTTPEQTEATPAPKL